MRIFNLYKHENCTDVAILPIKIFYVFEKSGYKVKVRWFNIVNPDNIYDINFSETIFIKANDLKRWHLHESL